jgi:uncharacterized NAD(P)/FAD-binding protein YdhS
VHDLAIVGGGLSGSLIYGHVIDALEASNSRRRGERINVALIEPMAELGPGIPYSITTTRPAFLMLESVAQSTPVCFQSWLYDQAPRLIRLWREQRDPLLDGWLAANEESLLAGRFEELCVPRRLFGEYVREQLAGKIQKAVASGRSSFTHFRTAALDVLPLEGEGYQIHTADAADPVARTVVIAVGCSRRRRAFELSTRQGYFHEPYADAFEGLRQAVLQRRSPSDVLLMGSGAAAIETIFFLARSPELRARLGTVHIVSMSGVLAGGALVAEGGSSDRPWARTRPAAREYVAAVRELSCTGQLSATAGRLVHASVTHEGLQVCVRSERGDLTLRAHQIVYCAGTGKLIDTESPLLRNLLVPVRPFRANESGAGFAVDTLTGELSGSRGAFLIGPLLNQGPAESHVESVLAVYRVSRTIADAVVEHIRSRRRG